MKTKLSPVVAAIRTVVLTFAATSFLAVLAFAQGQPSAGKSDPYAPQFLTNAPPPGFATRVDYLKSFTSEKDILNARRAGLINEDESMLAMEALADREQNKASMDTYGKVVDQEGQPLVGITVQGLVKVGIGDSEEHDTKTDAQGQFHFLGLHGQGLGIRLQKEGYEYGYKIPYQRPRDYLPDPSNPLVITMWKLRGAEPMVHDKEFYKIDPDGRIFTIDFVNRKIIEGTNAMGDLRVQIQRPAKIERGEKFDWSLVITAIGGGVIEATSAGYLYEAPESGYRQTYELHMSVADPNWQEQIEKTFFIKSRDGKVYGYFHVTIIPNYNDISVFKTESFINPAGSRNLEFDPAKEIMR